MHKSKRLLGWLVLPGIFLFPSMAHAHSPVKGANDIINGLLHPLTSLTHVLVIVALGLMAGRQPVGEYKAPFWTFALLSAIALGLTTAGGVREIHPAVLIVVSMCPAVLLALEKRPSVVAASVLFGVAALVLGLDSAVESNVTKQPAKLLIGNWISLNVLVFDLAVYVTIAGDAKWLKIALRVLGSWIIAIGLMVLAFSFKK